MITRRRDVSKTQVFDTGGAIKAFLQVESPMVKKLGGSIQFHLLTNFNNTYHFLQPQIEENAKKCLFLDLVKSEKKVHINHDVTTTS